MIFSFVLIKVFVAATKPNSKRNKAGFISYSPDYPPLNNRVKIEQVLNFFSKFGLMPLIKNFKLNKREILYSVGFTKPALNICV